MTLFRNIQDRKTTIFMCTYLYHRYYVYIMYMYGYAYIYIYIHIYIYICIYVCVLTCQYIFFSPSSSRAEWGSHFLLEMVFVPSWFPGSSWFRLWFRRLSPFLSRFLSFFLSLLSLLSLLRKRILFHHDFLVPGSGSGSGPCLPSCLASCLSSCLFSLLKKNQSVPS